MSNLISDAEWNEFRGAIQDAQDTFFNKTIIWRRKKSFLPRYGEDEVINYVDITLACLANYNYFRSWPVTNQTETGEQDRQSTQIIFTKAYLANLGYLNANGYFDFDPAYDRFIFDGQLCKADGDTPASQINGDDALFTLILRREELPTG